MIYQSFNFARINFLQEDIAELIFHEDIEVTKEMVDELHAYLKMFLKAPFSILVNKLNDYSYSFEAQQSGFFPETFAIAVVCYNQVSKVSLDVMLNVPRVVKWNIQIFNDRESTLLWLQEQQKGIRGSEDLEV